MCPIRTRFVAGEGIKDLPRSLFYFFLKSNTSRKNLVFCRFRTHGMFFETLCLSYRTTLVIFYIIKHIYFGTWYEVAGNTSGNLRTISHSFFFLVVFRTITSLVLHPRKSRGVVSRGRLYRPPSFVHGVPRGDGPNDQHGPLPGVSGVSDSTAHGVDQEGARSASAPRGCVRDTCAV